MGRRSDWKKHNTMGPMGMKCPCCGPAPGKEKTRCRRQWKRSARHQVFLQIKMEVDRG